MRRYEYRLIGFDDVLRAGDFKGSLNELGGEGWRLSCVVGNWYVFERQIRPTEYVCGREIVDYPPVTPQEEEAMREFVMRPGGRPTEVLPSLASIQHDLRGLDEAQLRAVIESCRVQLAVRGVKEAQSA